MSNSIARFAFRDVPTASLLHPDLMDPTESKTTSVRWAMADWVPLFR